MLLSSAHWQGGGGMVNGRLDASGNFELGSSGDAQQGLERASTSGSFQSGDQHQFSSYLQQALGASQGMPGSGTHCMCLTSLTTLQASE